MSQHQLAAVLTSLVTAILAVFILSKEGQRRVTRQYGVYTILISLWSFCWLRMISATSVESSLFWAKTLHIPASLIPATFLHFIQYFLNVMNHKVHKILRRVYYVSGVLFASISFLPILVESVKPKLGFSFYIEPGNLYAPFFGFFVAAVLIILSILLRAYSRELGIKKLQIAYILMGYSIGYLGGGAAFLPVFGFPIPAFSLYGVPICHLIIAYALIRYRAMDLNLIIRWGLAYGLLATLLVSFVVAVVTIFEKIGSQLGITPGILGVVIGCCVFFVFDPLRKRVSHFIDMFVFKSPDFRQLLEGMENELDSSNNIDHMAKGLKEQFKQIWNVYHAGFAIWDSTKSTYSLFPVDGFSDQIISRMNENIQQDDFLVRTLESERRLFKYGVIVEEEVSALSARSFPGEKATFEKIRRTMRWLGATVCAPLMVGDNLVGFMILGPKLNKKIYNDEDKKFIAHVSEKVANSVIKLMVSNRKGIEALSVKS